ncbi:Sensory/regulatory protein RpfC [compost metagenome]
MTDSWLVDPIIFVVLGVMALGLLAGLQDCLRHGRQTLKSWEADGSLPASGSVHAEHAGQLAAIHRVMAVIEFDLQGNILTANQNFLDLFGCSLAEIRGCHHQILCPPGVAESVAYRDLWERLGRGEYETGEYHRLSLDGRELWIQASYHPIFAADGKPGKVVKFASDISFHREMEGELLKAKERAERAAAAKSAFLANMSHEIRTPMNAIIGFTELLLGSSLDDMQRRHLYTVQYSARSLLGLLNDILDTAKLERGVIELEEVDFSLRELVERTCAVLRPNAAAKGVALNVDYSAALGECFRGDPLRIQQVLLNLLGNAIKFTCQGEVRLELLPVAGQIHMAVHDTGIGIPADRLEKIFEPFAQADASMSRRFGGTGLGTTIARQLVELMGGRIEVQSRPGEGSSFRVTLSLPAAQALPLQPVQRLPQLPSLHILVVDDVAQNVELLVVSLGRLGHRVSAASDGAQALAALQRQRFDVVLMDVQMPGTDGLAATRRWRDHEQAHDLPRTPLIALTAGVLERDREAAREAGMDGFAAKPVELDRLLGEIVRVIGGAQAPVQSGPVVGATTEVPVIDWPQGVALWGSEAALLRGIRAFCATQSAVLEELQVVLAGGVDAEAQQLLHRLRGSAGNLGLRRLCAQVGELERALRSGQREALLGAPQALRHALEQLLLQLPAPEGGEACPAAADCRAAVCATDTCPLVKLRSPLERLAAALQRGELDEQALCALAGSFDPHHHSTGMAALQAAIDDFDFDRALQLLHELQTWLDILPEGQPA